MDIPRRRKALGATPAVEVPPNEHTASCAIASVDVVALALYQKVHDVGIRYQLTAKV